MIKKINILLVSQLPERQMNNGGSPTFKLSTLANKRLKHAYRPHKMQGESARQMRESQSDNFDDKNYFNNWQRPSTTDEGAKHKKHVSQIFNIKNFQRISKEEEIHGHSVNVWEENFSNLSVEEHPITQLKINSYISSVTENLQYNSQRERDRLVHFSKNNHIHSTTFRKKELPFQKDSDIQQNIDQEFGSNMESLEKDQDQKYSFLLKRSKKQSPETYINYPNDFKKRTPTLSPKKSKHFHRKGEIKNNSNIFNRKTFGQNKVGNDVEEERNKKYFHSNEKKSSNENMFQYSIIKPCEIKSMTLVSRDQIRLGFDKRKKAQKNQYEEILNKIRKKSDILKHQLDQERRKAHTSATFRQKKNQPLPKNPEKQQLEPWEIDYCQQIGELI